MKKMFDDNPLNHDKVYKILESHFISRKAVEILLKENFNKEDYFEFINERKKTIIEAIENTIITDEIELPENLKELNERLEKLEIAFRDLIANDLNPVSTNPYKDFVPGDIQEKVNSRINQHLKKNPQYDSDDFEAFRKKLDYFDLQEYCKLITLGNVWVYFEDMFKNKQQLQDRFSKMGELRNAIRHIRMVDDVTRLDGEAAIVWFNSIFGKKLSL